MVSRPIALRARIAGHKEGCVVLSWRVVGWAMDWTRENQPFINFGLLVGAITYTVITAFILRVSARQLRASVQPALTFKRSLVGTERDARQPYLQRGVLEFQNSGVGAALNLTASIAVHAGGP